MSVVALVVALLALASSVACWLYLLNATGPPRSRQADPGVVPPPTAPAPGSAPGPEP
jgi:hypothetical protein